jgi:hypothetical protein
MQDELSGERAYATARVEEEGATMRGIGATIPEGSLQ